MRETRRLAGEANASATLPEFMDHLARADLDEAVSRVGRLRMTGASVSQIVAELLAPAMAEVGRRWQDGVSTIADEHAATAVVDASLAIASSPHYAPAVARVGSSVVLTCADGEWHSLPARMAADVLRSAGVQVTFLGASQPAHSLRSFLQEHPPTALAVSATVPTNLTGAARSIAAGHDAGVPVIVGGAAWGKDARRAEALGADAYVAKVAEALPVLEQWAHQRPPLRDSVTANPECLLVELKADDFVEAAYGELHARVPQLAQMSAQQKQSTRTDLGHILRFAAAAHLTGDESLLTDFTSWLLDVLRLRGVPVGVVRPAYSALADVAGDQLPAISRLLCNQPILDEPTTTRREAG